MREIRVTQPFVQNKETVTCIDSQVGGTIYPVAIKYDPKFGDAFWNSSQNGMLSYLFLMMSSWAIVCDVW